MKTISGFNIKAVEVYGAILNPDRRRGGSSSGCSFGSDKKACKLRFACQEARALKSWVRLPPRTIGFDYLYTVGR